VNANKKNMGWLEQPGFGLPTALDIRCNYALAKIVHKFGLNTEISVEGLFGAALGEATNLGFRDANRTDLPESGASVPAFFADEPELLEAWSFGVKAGAQRRGTL
jgi:hypothetical protein